MRERWQEHKATRRGERMVVPMEPSVVRRMTEADVDSAAALQVNSFGGVLADAVERFRGGPRYTWRDAWVIGERREIRALAIAIPVRWWFRGQAYPVSAIASVAVRAVDRRRGLASTVMRALLQAERDAGRPASLLYPFQHGFYRRLGYGTVGLMHYWRIPSAQLASQVSERHAVRSMREDDRPAICELYQRWLTHSGGLERSAAQWDQRWAKGGEHWVVYDGSGGLFGYLAYRDVDRAIELRELVAARPEAARGLWSFLGAQGEQRQEIRYHSAHGEPLWAQLGEPLMFEAANRGFVVNDAAALTVSCMARLVDLPVAFSRRPFPADVDGRFSLELRDPVFAPSGETVLVTLAGGQARVQPHAGAADVRCGVGCLSQLFCGALTAAGARWYGLLEGTDEAVGLLDRAFPPGPLYVFPADWF